MRGYSRDIQHSPLHLHTLSHIHKVTDRHKATHILSEAEVVFGKTEGFLVRARRTFYHVLTHP